MDVVIVDQNDLNVGEQIKICLLNQFHDIWDLLTYHLQTLTTEECLRRPGSKGPHIFQDKNGQWHGNLPEREDYDIGPPSIGWVSWHIIFWWSMVLNHSFGHQSLKIKDVNWPGDANALRSCLLKLRNSWVEEIQKLDGSDLLGQTRSRWPVQGRPFSAIVGWANMELMKNAAELGYIRYLYTQRNNK